MHTPKVTHWILIVLDIRKTCPWPAAAWNQSKTNQLTDLVWSESLPTDKIKNSKGEELLIPFSAADFFFFFLFYKIPPSNTSFGWGTLGLDVRGNTSSIVLVTKKASSRLPPCSVSQPGWKWSSSNVSSASPLDDVWVSFFLLIKLTIFFSCRALWDLQAEKDLQDQEGSLWVIFHLFQRCLASEVICRNKVTLGSFLFLSFLLLFFSHSVLFAVQPQGKQGEPGPSGKAGLPGTPVSVTPFFLAT